MNKFIIALACLAVCVNATPSGHDGGWGDGDGWGHGGHGGWDDGSWGHHSNVVLGNGAISVGAGVGHGHDGHGVGIVGVGLGGWGGHGHGHGVVVQGPPTAPAAIIGPGKTGKVVAHGLWGPVHHWGHGGHGGHGGW